MAMCVYARVTNVTQPNGRASFEVFRGEERERERINSKQLSIEVAAIDLHFSLICLEYGSATVSSSRVKNDRSIASSSSLEHIRRYQISDAAASTAQIEISVMRRRQSH